MAGDLRHGYGRSHKKTFQRKSQLTVEQTLPAPRSSIKVVWVIGVVLAVSFVVGYFVVHHFATKGVGKRSEAEKSLIAPAVVDVKVPVKVQQATPKVGGEKSINAVALNVDVPGNNQAEQPLIYSFYHGLSETEVVVDVEPLSVALDAVYYIQAGTFGNPEQANIEQARLKRLGQVTDISTFQGKRLYYRLRAGPFSDRLLLNKRRNELNRLGVETLVIKASKS